MLPADRALKSLVAAPERKLFWNKRIKLTSHRLESLAPQNPRAGLC